MQNYSGMDELDSFITSWMMGAHTQSEFSVYLMFNFEYEDADHIIIKNISYI